MSHISRPTTLVFICAFAATMFCTSYGYNPATAAAGQTVEKADFAATTNLKFDYQGSALWNGVEKAVVSGNYMYTAMVLGVRVFDISNPTLPQQTGQLYLPRFHAQAIALQGNFLYLIDHNSYDRVKQLLIVDVTDPLQPMLRGSCSLTATSFADLAVSGAIAYIVTPSDLQLINISNPDTPQFQSKLTLAGTPQKVALQGITAYVTYLSGGIAKIDVSNSLAPSVIGYIATGTNSAGIAVSGNFAYVTLLDSLLRVADLTLNTVVATYPVRSGYGGMIAGNYLFITTVGDTLRAFDISDSPVLTEIAAEDFLPYNVESIDGSHAILADWSYGIGIVDISTPAAPVLSGTVSFPTYPASFEVVAAGNYVFSTNRTAGLRVVDVSDPQNPTVVGQCDTPGEAEGIALDGNYVYVADYASGLQVIDITNPLSPSLVGNLDTPGRAKNIELSGTRAYIADHEGGIRIVDITNPATPTELGFWVDEFSSDFLLVAAAGNYLYAAAEMVGGSSRLYTLDVSNPADPQFLSSYTYPFGSLSVVVVSNIVYVATTYQRLEIIDVGDPQNPVGLGQFRTYDYTFEINIVGNTAYCANYTDGILALDISNPVSPKFMGEYGTALGWSMGVAVQGDNVYAATDNGLIVLKSGAFTCGDADANDIVTISDAVLLINYIFAGGVAPTPLNSGDADCNSIITISDAVYLINYIFTGGPEPCSQCLGK